MALYYSKWLSLPIHLRHEIAAHFDIRKTGPTHVDTDRIVSDGYSVEAVEIALTPDNLREFLGSDEKDEDALWDQLVHKNDPVEAPFAPVEPAPVPEKGSVEESNAKPEKVKLEVSPAKVEEPKKSTKPKK